MRIATSLLTRCGLAAIAFVLAGWFLQWPSPGAAARGHALTFVVNSTADAHAAHPGDGRCADRAGRCTLRAAVETADTEPAGTAVTIKVPSGRYELTLGSLGLTANTIAIAGTGSGAIAGAESGTVVIQAKGAFRVVTVGPAATATLSQVTVTGGNAGTSGYGGGVYSAGKLTVSGSVISGNTAVAGGGIANAGGTLTVTHTVITGNHAPYYGGGGIQNGGLRNVPGLVTVTDSMLAGNSSGGDGGGILNGQNGHPATARSAAASVRPGCLPVRRCAGGPDRPGAGRPPGPGLRLVVTGTQFAGNSSGNAGGGIANDGGVATVTGSALTGNSAGAAIGGGIEDYGSLTVRLSTLSANRAASGGGVEAYDAHVTVPSTATIEQSTLAGNKAEVGGGIDDSATVTVTASTLAANKAGQGAGVEVEGGSSISVLNSTITGNVGPGIETFQCSGGTVRYTTFDGNSSALSLSCSDLQLTGTIVAGSTAGPNCTGAAPAETAGYNLDSGTSCGFAKPTDLTSTGPKLGKLAGNGGPTMAQALRLGSPAINHAGTPATGCPPADQRGLPRPYGPACDIGSVEVHHT